MLKSLFQYREFLKSNVKKEIRGKYKGSFLGVLWSFLNPLLAVLVYAIIFPFIMKNSIDNYLVYLITGFIPWTFFTLSIQMGMVSILANANIIKKVYFPRIILPISSVTSALVNFCISLVIVLLFVIGSGIGVSLYLIYLPIIILIQYIMLLGITFILSSVDIYARDIENIVNFVIQMLFYGTPILYSKEIFPESIYFLLNLNPMTHIIDAYRAVLFYQTTPDFLSLGLTFFFSIILLFVGYFIFDKLQRGFAEEV
ncbi:MAG: ABC transporter permease [Mycoplasmatota bacterium]